MKNEQSITIETVHHNPVLEQMIKTKDSEIKELAERNAMHHAKRNRPDPLTDKLEPFTGEIRTGYERLAAEILHLLMPKSHFPQGKMDIDVHKDKDKKLEADIKTCEDKMHRHEYNLSRHNFGNINLRLGITTVFTLIIMLGEIIFNTKAFQVTGENMLFAMLLSITFSFAVFVFSHIAAFLYKAAKTAFRKRMVVFGSLTAVTVVFTALAIFRSTYLASHDVHISPVYFVIINVFFFIVSALLSLSLLPTWLEIKEHLNYMKLFAAVKKCKAVIKKLKQEQEENKKLLNESTKLRLQLIFYSKYATSRIRKLYYESLEVFKSTNLIFRTDAKTPACFSDIPQEPNIEEIEIFLHPNKQQQP